MARPGHTTRRVNHHAISDNAQVGRELPAGRTPPALFAAIGEFGEQATKDGILVDQGGLMPSAAGALVRVSGGKITVIDGPFTEAKEIIGGYATFQVRSKEEAIEHAVTSWSCTSSTGRVSRASPRFARSWIPATSSPGRPSRSSSGRQRGCVAQTGVRSVAVPAADVHPTIEAVWRIESARLIAGLVRMVRDVGLQRTSPKTLSSPRSSSGRSRASRTTRAPGSWPSRNGAGSTTSVAQSGWNASTLSSLKRSTRSRSCRTSTCPWGTTSRTTCCG